MKFTCVFYGKASGFAQAECEKYLQRMKNDVKIVELKESKLTQFQLKLDEEYKDFEKKIGFNHPIIVLAEEGRTLSSVQWAEWLGKESDRGIREIVLVIGSAYGIDARLKSQAKMMLSLSLMTLTHDHARVLLIEQIYRARCIQEGHPYHHV